MATAKMRKSRRVIPLACRICKKEFDFTMGYNWQACDKCTKEALDVWEEMVAANKAWADLEEMLENDAKESEELYRLGL